MERPAACQRHGSVAGGGRREHLHPRANPSVSVSADGAFYAAPSGQTYADGTGVAGQCSVRLWAPYYDQAKLKIYVTNFPGLGHSIIYAFQGYKEDRAGVCDRYARRGVEQNQENQKRRCGCAGSAWYNDYGSHYGWCMTARREDIDGGTRWRDAELKKCGGRRTDEFRNPSVRGYRIDRCLYWGQECDKPAADRSCRDRGYVEADSWQLAPARPTLVRGDGNICDADYCGGFSFINCAMGIR